jgi:hypothetical protein
MLLGKPLALLIKKKCGKIPGTMATIDGKEFHKPSSPKESSLKINNDHLADTGTKDLKTKKSGYLSTNLL